MRIKSCKTPVTGLGVFVVLGTSRKVLMTSTMSQSCGRQPQQPTPLSRSNYPCAACEGGRTAGRDRKRYPAEGEDLGHDLRHSATDESGNSGGRQMRLAPSLMKGGACFIVDLDERPDRVRPAGKR
jgi:hypothetical protein